MDISETIVVCAPVGVLCNYDLFCVSVLIAAVVSIRTVTQMSVEKHGLSTLNYGESHNFV